MEKYFNSFDRAFISDRFDGSFTDINGEPISGIISGASVYVAVICVNKHTGQPVYRENHTKEHVEYSAYNDLFSATIDAELGVLISPNDYAIAEYVGSIRCDNEEEIRVAFKITDYSIEIEERPCFSVSHMVSEETFRKIVSENFDKFNSADNYWGQSTAYGYHPVDKEYARDSWYVGYDIHGNVIMSLCASGAHFHYFFSSARTKDRAEYYASLLKQITPAEMLDIVYNPRRYGNPVTAIERLIERKRALL